MPWQLRHYWYLFTGMPWLVYHDSYVMTRMLWQFCHDCNFFTAKPWLVCHDCHFFNGIPKLECHDSYAMTRLPWQVCQDWHFITGLYAFGSARPIAEVVLADGKFNFEIPKQWEPGDANMKFTGALSGDQLKGTMVYTNGKNVLIW